MSHKAKGRFGKGADVREIKPVIGRALKPRIHHPPVQFLPIRHAQHSRSVQPAQVTAQLIGGVPYKLRVGRVFAQQYGFVLDQVLGHPVTEIGQNGVTDQVKSSQGEILINLFWL
jgi:hypothetical protein